MAMDIFQIDAQGQLFIAPDIDDWQPVTAHGITAVFDLDSDLDIGVLAERGAGEVGSSREDKINEIIPLVLAMGSESLGEGVGILCGVCSVQDTQTLCWVALNIPTANVIVLALRH
jgi:hypothetical protein